MGSISIPTSNESIAQPILTNLTNEILVKHIGLNVSTGALTNTTNFNKIPAPGDFDAVRVVVFHHEATTPVFKAIVAATETIDQSTDDNKYHPVVDGVAVKTLDAATGVGWFSVTWAGASSVTASVGTATDPSTVISDWIPITSIPRVDGSPFPALMTRLNITGATASYKLTSGATMRQPSVANRGFFYQNSSIADVTGAFLSTVSTDTSTIPLGTNTPLIAIQFRTRKYGISLMCIGDSLTQNNTVIPDTMSSWGLRTAATISALGIPCGSANFGSSSRSATQYAAPGIVGINTFKPNVVIIPTLSPNGPGTFNTDALTRDAIRQQAAIVSNLESAALNIRAVPIIWGSMPASTTTVSSDIIRDAYINSIMISKKYSIDWANIFKDGASPSRIKTLFQYDIIHPNEAGVNLQTNILVQKLRELYGI